MNKVAIFERVAASLFNACSFLFFLVLFVVLVVLFSPLLLLEKLRHG